MSGNGEGPRVRGADATTQEIPPTVPHSVPEQLDLGLGVEPVPTVFADRVEDIIDIVARLAVSPDILDAEAVRRDPACPVAIDPNWWGLAFAEAHRRGLIVPVGFGIATRRERHGSTLRRWVGRAWSVAA